jgi:hypothetical protein
LIGDESSGHQFLSARGRRSARYRERVDDAEHEPDASPAQPSVHRHEQQPRLPAADEQADGDNRQPAHIRPWYEEDCWESDQSEAQRRKEKRRERFEADVDNDEVDCPTHRDDEREDCVPARHQRDAVAASVMRRQA